MNAEDLFKAATASLVALEAPDGLEVQALRVSLKWAGPSRGILVKPASAPDWLSWREADECAAKDAESSLEQLLTAATTPRNGEPSLADVAVVRFFSRFALPDYGTQVFDHVTDKTPPGAIVAPATINFGHPRPVWFDRDDVRVIENASDRYVVSVTTPAGERELLCWESASKLIVIKTTVEIVLNGGL
jgi:hypothetical protein